jgi:ankyrin repeat protein
VDLENQLISAIRSKNLEEVQKLLGRGADPNGKHENGDSILDTAISFNNAYIVKELLEGHATIDDDTFYNAVTHSDLLMIRLLFAYDAKPNGKNKKGDSILNAAVLSKNQNRLDIIRLLLDKGAVLDNKTFYNAVNHGDLAIVNLLLDRVANPNTKFSNGDSILNAAVLSRNENRLDIIRLLLDKGANPHYRNKKTNMSITSALISKQNEEKKVEILRLLINASRKKLQTEIYKREIGMRNIPGYSQMNENLRKFIVLESFWREACYGRKSQLKLTAFAAELGLINIDTSISATFTSADTLCQMIGKELDRIRDPRNK